MKGPENGLSIGEGKAALRKDLPDTPRGEEVALRNVDPTAERPDQSSSLLTQGATQGVTAPVQDDTGIKRRAPSPVSDKVVDASNDEEGRSGDTEVRREAEGDGGLESAETGKDGKEIPTVVAKDGGKEQKGGGDGLNGTSRAGKRARPPREHQKNDTEDAGSADGDDDGDEYRLLGKLLDERAPSQGFEDDHQKLIHKLLKSRDIEHVRAVVASAPLLLTPVGTMIE